MLVHEILEQLLVDDEVDEMSPSAGSTFETEELLDEAAEQEVEGLAMSLQAGVHVETTSPADATTHKTQCSS
jgi:hypothetical protein